MRDKNDVNSNPFVGCTIVATGKLKNFTRDGINNRIISLGATAANAVTRKTNYLICGDKPGSKLVKARELGIPVLTEQEFLRMHEMKIQTGKEIPEQEVMKVALKEESNLPAIYSELIRGMLREKIHSLELELVERGYSLDYINIIYVGGGALIAKDYAGKYRCHTAYDCDLCANAKGYEFLVSQMMGKQV